jgi:tetratricopeptide (TPR) repeat protein
VKKPQWITVLTAVGLLVVILVFGRIVPKRKQVQPSASATQSLLPAISSDTIISQAKRQITPDLLNRLAKIEDQATLNDSRVQKLEYYHELAHFWGDTVRMFEPYAWYEAEAARLENSEKSLTFAAHLFLENLQQDNDPERIRWKALQAKDLFERSLRINPNNDSSKVGLGACYLFGQISPAPMEGIGKIREVADRDSTNIYAQMMLVKGAVISGQYDRAITRLLTVTGIDPKNVEASLMLADVYERVADKPNAILWYKKSLPFISREDVKLEIEKRIQELSN